MRWSALTLILACASTKAPSTHLTIAPSASATSSSRIVATAAPLSRLPAYDLVADRLSIAEVARGELGPTLSVQTAQDVFVLVAAPGWNAHALAVSTDLTTRAIEAYFNGRFERKPTRAIGVYLFADLASYQAYCKAHLGGECSSPFGMYHPSVRRIVMNAGPGLGTLTHELIHPIVESDFPRAPTWVNEGMASLFEAPVMPQKGEIHGVKNWRHPRLIAGMRSAAEKEDARLDALFGMSDDAFRGSREKLHYATARYVCQWLDSNGWLWPFYRAYRDGFDSDASGVKAFERVTGMTPRTANAKWTAWVTAL